MTGGSPVQDPLRFGAEEEDLEDEVPLHDEPLGPSYEAPTSEPPLAAASAFAPPALAATPPTDFALSHQDPLSAGPRSSRASSYGGDYPLPGATATQPPLGHHAPSSAAGGSPLFSGASPSAGASAPAVGAGPSQLGGGGLGADSGEIQSDDAGWMQRGAAALGGAPPALRISVTDPVKRVSDSIIPGVKGGHYEYLVTTVADHPRRRVEVRRRFNDFVALADLLSTSHRGYFVFPRPDKNSLEGQVWPPSVRLLRGIAKMGKKDFIETRRTDLDRYLNKLAQHPAVGRCEALKVFLEAEGPLNASYAWQQLQPLKGSLLEGVARLPRQLIGSDSAVPSTVEAAQNAKHTSDLLRRFREAGERMRQEYKAPPTLPDDEGRLRGDRTVVEEYQEKVAVASRKAERVVQQFEELGQVLGDLGLALIKLAKFEDETGMQCGQYSDWGAACKTIAADARRVGMSSVRLSRLSRAATAQVVDSLEPLHDELALAPAVAGALREREAALLTVQCIDEDMAKKKKSVEQLEEQGGRVFGGDKAKTRKVAGLHNDIAALEAAQSSATSEYERVKGRNEEELLRWRQEKAGEYVRMARGFAQVNSLYDERCAQQSEWEVPVVNLTVAGFLQQQEQHGPPQGKGQEPAAEEQPRGPGDEGEGKNPHLQKYLESLRQLKGTTTLQKQVIGEPEAPWWYQLVIGLFERWLQRWASQVIRARVDEEFTIEEFLEGAKDAYWMVNHLLSNDDFEALKAGMLSAKLVEALETTRREYAEAGFVWRTQIEGGIQAGLRGLSFWGKDEMAAYDPIRAAEAPEREDSAAALLKRPAGMWMVLTVALKSQQEVTVSRLEGGTTSAQMTDYRPQHWRFAVGPLPDGLPARRLDLPWFLVAI
ncbi:hypothetical protein N2152v2_011196 [Parachlorella kessleri]